MPDALPKNRIHVVAGSQSGGWGLMLIGVYKTYAAANRARRKANETHGRIKGTIGSFKIVTTEVRDAD